MSPSPSVDTDAHLRQLNQPDAHDRWHAAIRTPHAHRGPPHLPFTPTFACTLAPAPTSHVRTYAARSNLPAHASGKGRGRTCRPRSGRRCSNGWRRPCARGAKSSRGWNPWIVARHDTTPPTQILTLTVTHTLIHTLIPDRTSTRTRSYVPRHRLSAWAWAWSRQPLGESEADMDCCADFFDYYADLAPDALRPTELEVGISYNHNHNHNQKPHQTKTYACIQTSQRGVISTDTAPTASPRPSPLAPAPRPSPRPPLRRCQKMVWPVRCSESRLESSGASLRGTFL